MQDFDLEKDPSMYLSPWWTWAQTLNHVPNPSSKVHDFGAVDVSALLREGFGLRVWVHGLCRILDDVRM